jgi:hypothetical protein
MFNSKSSVSDPKHVLALDTALQNCTKSPGTTCLKLHAWYRLPAQLLSRRNPPNTCQSACCGLHICLFCALIRSTGMQCSAGLSNTRSHQHQCHIHPAEHVDRSNPGGKVQQDAPSFDVHGCSTNLSRVTPSCQCYRDIALHHTAPYACQRNILRSVDDCATTVPAATALLEQLHTMRYHSSTYSSSTPLVHPPSTTSGC